MAAGSLGSTTKTTTPWSLGQTSIVFYDVQRPAPTSSLKDKQPRLPVAEPWFSTVVLSTPISHGSEKMLMDQPFSSHVGNGRISNKTQVQVASARTIGIKQCGTLLIILGVNSNLVLVSGDHVL